MTDEEARVLTLEKYISDFYDQTVAVYPNYKAVANLFLTEVMRRVKEIEGEAINIDPADFAEVVKMAETNVVNRNDAKAIIRVMFEEGGKPMDIAKANNYIVVEDTQAIEAFIENLLNEKADLLQQYFDGKTNLFGFFMGQANRALQGKATPKSIRECLEKAIAARRG